jgi:calcium permeable stress-gated cation channel
MRSTIRAPMGLNHDELGSVYSEIQTWRTRLKTVNEDIRIAQGEGYQAIVDGVHVKGWLLTRRGLRLAWHTVH